jgi:hypothetical protein
VLKIKEALNKSLWQLPFIPNQRHLSPKHKIKHWFLPGIPKIFTPRLWGLDL